MLLDVIKSDMKQAMKDKDKATLSTLRMLLSLVETERGKIAAGKVFTDEEIIGLINRNIKQLQKEKEAYNKAGVLSDSQDREIAVLQRYLPQQMTEEEIREAVAPVIQKAKADNQPFGFVMKQLSVLKGQADMSLVNKIAKELWG